jgi:hypothetical protein
VSFLFPLYLAGAAAIALPILFHLIRRSPRDRVAFSSLMFLRQSPPRVTRRSRLENIMLLLLRAAALGLLAFAFARPFLRQPVLADVGSQRGRIIIVLLDTSASMRRGDLWQQAMNRFQRVIEGLTPADRVAVFTFDRQVRQAAGFDEILATPPGGRAAWLEEKARSLAPTWGPTHLGTALATTADTLENYAAQQPPDVEKPELRLVLISDLARGSDLSGLRNYEWPESVRLEVQSLAARSPSNAGLQLPAGSESIEPAAADSVRVRVVNAADSERDQFRVRWGDANDTAVAIYVPPGKSRVVSLPLPDATTHKPEAQARDRESPSLALRATVPDSESSASRIILEGDDYDFDNSVYLVPPQRRDVSVLLVSSSAADDPRGLRYYLDRAFPDTAHRSVQVVAQSPSEPIQNLNHHAIPLVVLTESPPSESDSSLRQYVQGGGTMLVVLTDTALADYLARAFELDGIEADEADSKDYVMLSEIDFGHRLFAPFSDPRFGDFTKIHFWKHRRIDMSRLTGARVLARFDNAYPALVEIQIGRGSLFILAAGWHPPDSQLAVSSKFVPLINGFLDHAAPAGVHFGEFFVGDPVALPAEAGPEPTIRGPNDESTTLKKEDASRFTATEPGIYFVARSSPIDGPPLRFAVNLDPHESETSPLPVEELEQLGVRLTSGEKSRHVEAEHARRRQMLAVELESRQKLWRWIIIGSLAVLFVETWLAGWLTRRV